MESDGQRELKSRQIDQLRVHREILSLLIDGLLLSPVFSSFSALKPIAWLSLFIGKWGRHRIALLFVHLDLVETVEADAPFKQRFCFILPRG